VNFCNWNLETLEKNLKNIGLQEGIFRTVGTSFVIFRISRSHKSQLLMFSMTLNPMTFMQTRHLKTGFKPIKLHSFIRKAKFANLGDHKHASQKCKVSGHSNPQIIQTNQPIYVHSLFPTNEVNNLQLTKTRKHSEFRKCHTL
jgi:hypothetical protein